MSDISKRSKTYLKKKLPRLPLREEASLVSEGHIFISYSRDNRNYVNKLSEWLRGHGTKVWFDHDINYGATWETEIQNKLDTSTVVLVIMSKSAQRSKWVTREVERAKQKKILILPLLLEQGGIVGCVADLQFENVIGENMPRLRFCQKLPGFLVSESDIVNALTAEQRDIAKRISSIASYGYRLGNRGPAVAALQTELTRVGLDPGPINGVFGRKTLEAVQAFQKRRCLISNADGIPGPITWMILANSSLGDLAPTIPVMFAQ
jgi:hypothetical protein